MDLSGAWELLSSLPSQVLPYAFLIFVLITLLRAVGLISESQMTQYVVLVVSFFASGGLDIDDPEAMLIAGSTAILASLIHKLWERLLPVVQSLGAKVLPSKQ